MKIFFLALLPIMFLSSCGKIEVGSPVYPQVNVPCNEELEVGVVVDIDGNPYRTLMVGDKEYTWDYLKTTKYNDGTSISNVTNDTEWANTEEGAWCFFENGDPDSSLFGYAVDDKLYNWNAVNSGKLCPEGWHTITDSEQTAFDYLLQLNTRRYTPCNGVLGIRGDYIPIGFRMANGDFDSSTYLNSWTSTSYDDDKAWSRKRSYYGYNLRTKESKNAGLTCRCVKD